MAGKSDINLRATAGVEVTPDRIDTKLVSRAVAAALGRVDIPKTKVKADIGVEPEIDRRALRKEIRRQAKEVRQELQREIDKGAKGNQERGKKLMTQQQVLEDLDRLMGVSASRGFSQPAFQKVISGLREGTQDFDQLNKKRQKQVRDFIQFEKQTAKALQQVQTRAGNIGGVGGAGQPEFLAALGVGSESLKGHSVEASIERQRKRKESIYRAEEQAYREDARRTKQLAEERTKAEREAYKEDERRQREMRRREQEAQRNYRDEIKRREQAAARRAEAGRVAAGRQTLAQVGGTRGINRLSGHPQQDVALETLQTRRRIQQQRMNAAFAGGAGVEDGNVQRLQKRIRETDKAIKTLQGRLQRLNQVQSQTTNLMRQFFRYALGYGALYAALNAVNQLRRGIVEMNKELVSIQAIAQATAGEMKVIESAITATALSTKFGVQEIAKSARVLAQSGVEANELPTTLASTAQFAAATESSIETAADLISTMRNVFSDMSDSQLSNQLTKAVNISKLTADDLKSILSISAGVSSDYNLASEQYLAAVTTLRNAGLKASTVATGLRQGILELFTPTGRTMRILKKRYEEIGEDLSEAAISNRFFEFRQADNPLVAGLRELERIGYLGSGQGTLSRMFNVRSENAVRALIRDLDELEKSSTQLNFGTAALRGSDTQMQSLANTMDNLGAAITALTYDLSRGLVESLQEVAEAATGGVESLVDLNKELEKATGSGLSGNLLYGLLAGGAAGLRGFGSAGLGRRIAGGALTGLATTGAVTGVQSQTSGLPDWARTGLDAAAVMSIMSVFSGIRKDAAGAGAAGKGAIGKLGGKRSGASLGPVIWLIDILLGLFAIGGKLKSVGKIVLRSAGWVGVIATTFALISRALTDTKKQAQTQADAAERRRLDAQQEVREFREETDPWLISQERGVESGSTAREAQRIRRRSLDVNSALRSLPGGGQLGEDQVDRLRQRTRSLRGSAAEVGTPARREALRPIAEMLGLDVDDIEGTDTDRALSNIASEANAIEDQAREFAEELAAYIQHIEEQGNRASEFQIKMRDAYRAAQADPSRSAALLGDPEATATEVANEANRFLSEISGYIRETGAEQIRQARDATTEALTKLLKNTTAGNTTPAQVDESVERVFNQMITENDLSMDQAQRIFNESYRRAVEEIGREQQGLFERLSVWALGNPSLSQEHEDENFAKAVEKAGPAVNQMQSSVKKANESFQEALTKSRSRALEEVEGLVAFFDENTGALEGMFESTTRTDRARQMLEQLRQDPNAGVSQDPSTGRYRVSSDLEDLQAVESRTNSRKSAERALEQMMNEIKRVDLPRQQELIRAEAEAQRAASNDRDFSAAIDDPEINARRRVRDLKIAEIEREIERVEREYQEEAAKEDGDPDQVKTQQDLRDLELKRYEEEHSYNEDRRQAIEDRQREMLEREDRLYELRIEKLDDEIAYLLSVGDFEKARELGREQTELQERRADLTEEQYRIDGELTQVQKEELALRRRNIRPLEESARFQDQVLQDLRRRYSNIGVFSNDPVDNARAAASDQVATQADESRQRRQRIDNLRGQSQAISNQITTLQEAPRTEDSAQRLQQLRDELQDTSIAIAEMEETQRRMEAGFSGQMSEFLDADRFLAQISKIDGGILALANTARTRVVQGVSEIGDSFTEALFAGESMAAGLKETMRNLFQDLAAMAIKQGFVQIMTMGIQAIGGSLGTAAASGGGGGNAGWADSGTFMAAGGGIATREGKVVNSVVRGPGTGTSDSIAAALIGKGGVNPLAVSAGEGILTAKAVRMIGEQGVHDLNRMAAQRMATGGIAGGAKSDTAPGGRSTAVTFNPTYQFQVDASGGDAPDDDPELQRMLEGLGKQSEMRTRQMIEQELRPGGMISSYIRNKKG